MQLGICLPHYGVTMEPAGMRTFAERVEALGFDSIWVTDHVIVPSELDIVYKRRMLDSLTTLGFLAGVTQRLRLGTSVIILPYRNPIVLAKELASVDALSGGRLIFGAAAGWMEGEFRTLNAEFEHRGDVSDEHLRVIRALWSSTEPTYASDAFDIGGVSFSPETAQQPHPPIWIGGSSKRAMRRAVELGEGWHPNQAGPAQVAEGIEYMRRLSDARGRADVPAVSTRIRVAFDGSARPGRVDLTGSPSEMAASIGRFERAGVVHMALSFPEVPFEEAIEQLDRFAAEVRPLVR